MLVGANCPKKDETQKMMGERAKYGEPRYRPHTQARYPRAMTENATRTEVENTAAENNAAENNAAENTESLLQI